VSLCEDVWNKRVACVQGRIRMQDDADWTVPHASTVALRHSKLE
jgi:hypothetical protein